MYYSGTKTAAIIRAQRPKYATEQEKNTTVNSM